MVEALARDPKDAPVDPANRVMLDYVTRLTLRPAGVGRADVARLREAGFSHAAILDICQVAAYYAFVNRVAEGLGVELEPYWDDAGEAGHESHLEGEGPG